MSLSFDEQTRDIWAGLQIGKRLRIDSEIYVILSDPHETSWTDTARVEREPDGKKFKLTWEDILAAIAYKKTVKLED